MPTTRPQSSAPSACREWATSPRPRAFSNTANACRVATNVEPNVGEIALDEVREVTTKTGKVRRIKLRKKGSSTREVVDYKGKKRRVTYALIRTDEQARRANEINEELYGPSEIVGNVQERPFMKPAVELASVEFPDLYLKGG